MGEINIDIDMEMYMKFEDYRYNAEAEGARPMGFAAWKSTPIAQDFLARLEAKQTAQQPPLPADTVADGGAGDASYARGYEAGLLDGYTGVDRGMVARFEALQSENARLRAALAAASERIEWAEEILDLVEDTAPKDWPMVHDGELPHDWYHTGQLVREYRVEYPQLASAQQAADGIGV